MVFCNIQCSCACLSKQGKCTVENHFYYSDYHQVKYAKDTTYKIVKPKQDK